MSACSGGGTLRAVADPNENSFQPTRIVLVRHGESEVTVRRVVGGPRSCSGLSELGRRQAEHLARRLAEAGEIDADVLYASGYRRARETAEIIAPALGLEVRIDEAFGEHDPGPDCDGLTYQEFVDRHGTPDWEADPHAVTFPGGETVATFHHRIGKAMRTTLDQHPGATVVVVCHGGVVDAVLRSALRTSPTGVFEVHTLNTSLTELLLVAPGRWRLLRYNDTAHLTGLPAETPRHEPRGSTS
jgi:2,3-bisphosphoglycerate-dependent phosphoglycerate mutase